MPFALFYTLIRLDFRQNHTDQKRRACIFQWGFIFVDVTCVCRLHWSVRRRGSWSLVVFRVWTSYQKSAVVGNSLQCTS